MNIFARFDETPAMTLKDIKETKRYGGIDGWTDRWKDRWTMWKRYTPRKLRFAGVK